MNARSTSLVAVLIALVPIAACGDDETDGGSSDVGSTTTAGDTAADTTADNAADTVLDVHYSHPDADVEFSYGLECGNSGGELSGAVEESGVDASAACDALTEPAVVERLVEGPDHDVCTEIYGGPDVAEVTGTIDGEQVDTTIDRTNGCAINDWDELLDSILPPAIGVEPGN